MPSFYVSIVCHTAQYWLKQYNIESKKGDESISNVLAKAMPFGSFGRNSDLSELKRKISDKYRKKFADKLKTHEDDQETHNQFVLLINQLQTELSHESMNHNASLGMAENYLKKLSSLTNSAFDNLQQLNFLNKPLDNKLSNICSLLLLTSLIDSCINHGPSSGSLVKLCIENLKHIEGGAPNKPSLLNITDYRNFVSDIILSLIEQNIPYSIPDIENFTLDQFCIVDNIAKQFALLRQALKDPSWEKTFAPIELMIEPIPEEVFEELENESAKVENEGSSSQNNTIGANGFFKASPEAEVQNPKVEEKAPESDKPADKGKSKNQGQNKGKRRS